MKKILALIILISVIMTSLISCKNKNESNSEDNVEHTGDEATNDGGNNGKDNEDNTEKLPKVNILDDDLSSYIEIEEKYYKGYEVAVDRGLINMLVENEIIKSLFKYRSETSQEGDGIISVGDLVNIYYKGYYVEDGKNVFFAGGDNTSSQTPYALEIGSGGFIPGFEYNLIGKNPADYNADEPIVVETYFPSNYQSAELAGKIAYFIVTVESMVEYDAPVFDDDFVTEKLKISEDALEKYEGDGLAAKYRASVEKSVVSKYGLDAESLVVDAFWDSVLAGAVVKEYPEGLVEEAYDGYIAELEYYYSLYSAYFEYDEFMCIQVGLESGSDWRAALVEMAQENIKIQLIFYHIMNVEGLKPTKEEYDNLFDEYVISVLEENGITEDDFDTKESYLAKIKEYKEKLIKENGEEYFKSMIYYQIGIEEIKKYANIVERD